MSVLTYNQPFQVIATKFGFVSFRLNPINPLQILIEDSTTSQLRVTLTFSLGAGGLIRSAVMADSTGVPLITQTGLAIAPAVIAAGAASLAGGADWYPLFISLEDDDTRVIGSSGDDRLETGLGNDTVAGGAGDDRIYKWGAGDLTANGGTGIDTLLLQPQQTLAAPNTPVQQMVVNLSTGTGLNPFGGILTLSNIENVIGTGAADRITGNNNANVIGDGFSDAGADIVNALGGDDIVKITDLALARANGGAGFDTLQFLGSIDLQDVSFTSRYTNFEKYQILTFFILPPASTLRGDAAANWFVCDDGQDILEGRGGNDTLDGGDAFKNDFSPGVDVAVYSGLRKNYTITVLGGTLTITDKRGGSPDGTDTLINIETLRFSNGDVDVSSIAPNLGRTFVGTGVAEQLSGTLKNDTFYGLAGDDTMYSGGGGDDVFFGGTGNDTYYVFGAGSQITELPGQGVDTIYFGSGSSSTGFSLAALPAVENLIFQDFSGAPQFSLTVTGNGLDNTLESGDYDDSLTGAAGNDSLLGRSGEDVLFGGSGDDTLNGGFGLGTLTARTGKDVMTGGGGNDVFYFNNVFESGTSAGARDIITDFDPNAADRIDLSTFDAIPGGAHDPLTFIGAAGFTGIGQVRSVIFGATTQIQINASGTTAPDMIIQLTGALVLDVTDFIL